MGRDDRPWSEAELKQLFELTGKLTAQGIADKLGRTKNAVIGKANREHVYLPRPPKKIKENRSDSPKPQKPKPKPSPIPAIPLVERSGVRLAMLALRESQCRWPVGSPGHDDFSFCSAPVDPYASVKYCAEHRAKAFAHHGASIKNAAR